MNDDVAKLAKSLNKSEVFRLTHGLIKASAENLWHFPNLRDRGAMRRSFEAKGLVSSNGIMTKLGLAVRDYLKGTDDD